jgi:hypothetical protein
MGGPGTVGMQPPPKGGGKPVGEGASAAQLGCSPRPRPRGSPVGRARGAQVGCSRRPRAAGNLLGRARGGTVGMQPSAKADGKPVGEGGWTGRALRARWEGVEGLGRGVFNRLVAALRAAPALREDNRLVAALRAAPALREDNRLVAGLRAAPARLSFGTGREWAGHFRRLAPPSFAAQNPRQGAAVFICADGQEGYAGSLTGVWRPFVLGSESCVGRIPIVFASLDRRLRARACARALCHGAPAHAFPIFQSEWTSNTKRSGGRLEIGSGVRAAHA